MLRKLASHTSHGAICSAECASLVVDLLKLRDVATADTVDTVEDIVGTADTLDEDDPAHGGQHRLPIATEADARFTRACAERERLHFCDIALRIGSSALCQLVDGQFAQHPDTRARCVNALLKHIRRGARAARSFPVLLANLGMGPPAASPTGDADGHCGVDEMARAIAAAAGDDEDAACLYASWGAMSRCKSTDALPPHWPSSHTRALAMEVAVLPVALRVCEALAVSDAALRDAVDWQLKAAVSAKTSVGSTTGTGAFTEETLQHSLDPPPPPIDTSSGSDDHRRRIVPRAFAKSGSPWGAPTTLLEMARAGMSRVLDMNGPSRSTVVACALLLLLGGVAGL